MYQIAEVAGACKANGPGVSQGSALCLVSGRLLPGCFGLQGSGVRQVHVGGFLFCEIVPPLGNVIL